ncbi:hypothetical protein LAV84_04160 [Rhizobium sp. VS19-DR104.2]|uniref:hypothetical protein n=1 Tax=unclassified Rhizobium TaxID=2613769 RepID=UPI001C5A990C|nr:MULTISPECIES: hypothetical protein [unclassified Rhizobium]MBZ5758122.1 hypothetical protein [Rhizobium sp. VS19-DR96]MBZ5765048.1 hypothetical protein [Rhizobium sp. VS19-DR129.2]MBZ5772591.1 hypothetical protein [Rhizobium sp. VS19-DRK62.2]MBZ5782722.1 hypothetical protein [Rhizobium sp. VS19-DR121]MBZ5800170.1 hypothetical protein [Rhizobium sp. VS19-DR181]
MTSRTLLLTSFASFALLGSLTLITPASALTMKECSVKYKAAQAAGTLNGMKWNDYRTAQCGADAAAAPAAAAPAATTAAAPTKANTMAAKPTATKAADEPDATAPPAKEPAKPTMAAPAGLSLPTAVSPKYASETAGKARFHTCVDAYHDAKAKNALAGVKWIQKGGGYYSLCNSKLKG